jgi:hypothetical protein
MAKKKATRAGKKTAANVGYEAQLWQMADALRGSMDAAEFKHVVRGLDLPVDAAGSTRWPDCDRWRSSSGSSAGRR